MHACVRACVRVCVRFVVRYRFGHWTSFSVCLSLVSLLVQQLGLAEQPRDFVFSDFLRVVSIQWTVEEQARLCCAIALPALLGGNDLPKATSGTALERSNAWLEVQRKRARRVHARKLAANLLCFVWS